MLKITPKSISIIALFVSFVALGFATDIFSPTERSASGAISTITIPVENFVCINDYLYKVEANGKLSQETIGQPSQTLPDGKEVLMPRLDAPCDLRSE